MTKYNSEILRTVNLVLSNGMKCRLCSARDAAEGAYSAPMRWPMHSCHNYLPLPPGPCLITSYFYVMSKYSVSLASGSFRSCVTSARQHQMFRVRLSMAVLLPILDYGNATLAGSVHSSVDFSRYSALNFVLSVTTRPIHHSIFSVSARHTAAARPSSAAVIDIKLAMLVY